MADLSVSKAGLRSALRQRRNALSPAAQQAAAHALTQSVTRIPAWAAARRIALYIAADGEIDPGPVTQLARAAGKHLFLPVVGEGDRLDFAHWESGANLLRNRFDIPEPAETAARCPAAALEIIFLPLVAFDLQGGRLGMGGGFYDRTLAGITGPLLVALAHDCQHVESVPRDDWDIDMDFIATDVALYCGRLG